MTKSESERFNPSSASLVCLAVNLNHEFIKPNNRINPDWYFRCAPLPAGYAGPLGMIDTTKMMRPRSFLFLPILVILLLASCVMLPVPTKESKVLAGKPVKDEQLSFLKPKITTKDEVIERLGHPNIIWDDARAFIYDWDMRQGILFWAVGAYVTGNAGMTDIPKHYQFIARFDEQDRVVDFTRMTRPLFQRYADFLTEWLKNSSGQVPAERGTVNIAEKAMVLLNVQCTIDNQPYEPFSKPTFTIEPIFVFGLGSFETVGEPRFVSPRFLSEESRREGWTYFMLPPGVYYLAVLGPDSNVLAQTDAKYMQKAPRWRMDIPQDTKVVYVGTLQFAGKSDGEYLFGGKMIVPSGGDEPTIRDDHLIASGLVSAHFPDAGEVRTVLMQRWRPGDPVIIRFQNKRSGAVSDTRP